MFCPTRSRPRSSSRSKKWQRSPRSSPATPRRPSLARSCRSKAVGRRSDTSMDYNTQGLQKESDLTRSRNIASARGNGAATNERPALPGQVVLVLQGGGALGAYQVGVYEALHAAGIEPDWVIGTSIGAINAALIAGNAPENRMERLREFWSRVEQGASHDFMGPWTRP